MEATEAMVAELARPKSFREMCELIAEHLKATKQIDVDPSAIFHMSPTGELYPVICLYHAALEWKYDATLPADLIGLGGDDE